MEQRRPRNLPALALLAVATAGLLLNDHLLKGAGLLPGWLTGKLSDVCGLIVAPAVLAAVLRVQGGRLLALLAVATFFIAIKTSVGAAAAAEAAFAAVGLRWRIWCDLTDLFALPALGLGWWISRPVQAPADWQRRRGALVMVGAAACLASGVLDHSAPGYLVNRTEKRLVVVVSDIDGGGRGSVAFETLRAAPDAWFREEDFGAAKAYDLEPGGVLPLGARIVKLAVGPERRVLLVDSALPRRELPNTPDEDELKDDSGLLFVHGSEASPGLRPGRGVHLRAIALRSTPIPATTCAAATVPRLEFSPNPLPARSSARIAYRSSLGPGCFSLVLVPTAGIHAKAADGGAEDADPPPDADGDAADAADAAVDEAAPSADANHPDVFEDALPPLTSDQILRFCLPEHLFPFKAGDEIAFMAGEIRGLLPGSPRVLLRKTDVLDKRTEVAGPPLPCGLVRDACGAIWQPRPLTLNGVPLEAGVPTTVGSKTYYLARSMDLLTSDQQCAQDPHNFEWMEIDVQP